jgi:hypothetical protein
VGIEQGTLPGCEAAVESQTEAQAKQESETKVGKPRYEVIDREQLCWRRVDVERLIGAEHPARAVWEFIGQLDLSAYQEEVRARLRGKFSLGRDRLDTHDQICASLENFEP